MTEGKAVVKGIGWLAGGRLAGVFISFISTAILARLLKPEDFGVMAMSLIVINLAIAIFDGAFAVDLARRKDVDDRYISTAFWLSLILAVVLAALISAASPILAGFFGARNYSSIFVVSSLSLIFKAMENIAIAQMRRQGQYKEMVQYQFWSSLIGYGPVSIALAYYGYGAWSLVWGQLAVSVISAFGSVFVARVPVTKPFEKASAISILKTSAHFTIAQILNWAALTGPSTIVGHSMGAHSLGIYSRGWKLLDVVTSVTGRPLQGVLVPSFGRIQDEPERARSAFLKSLSMAVPIFATLTAFSVAHASFIVQVALGPKWGDTVLLVQILFCVLVPRCCYKITESVAVGFGHSKSVAVRQALYAGLMVFGAWFAARYGVVWVSIAASIAVTLFYVSSLMYAAKICSVKGWEVLTIHLASLLICVSIVGLDFSVQIVLASFNFWVVHLVSGGVAVSVTLALFAALPPRLVGPEFAGLRTKVFRRLQSRLI